MSLIDMGAVNRQMIGAVPYYRAVTPNVTSLFKLRLSRVVVRGIKFGLMYRNIRKKKRNGATNAEVVGGFVAGRIIRVGLRPVRQVVTKTHITASRRNYDMFRKNGLGGRTWYDGASRQDLVIVFHDANRAGPHIDVHIGRLSLVYHVPVDIYNQLKYNNNGYLTENSQKMLMDMVRENIQNATNCPQNLDHSKTNARASWTFGDTSAKTYGSGYTRQIIHESTVDIYKAHYDGPIEMYAPSLNPHRGLYLYKIYDGGGKTAPIVVFGAKRHDPTGLEDRLHLKMITENEATFVADMSSATIKYDGASCYFIIGPKGTTVWSPRTSVKTGERIEYTHKVNGIATLTSKDTIVGMGELLYKDRKGNYIPAAQTGGILNSQAVLSKDYKPEIRIYRIDKVGKVQTTNLPFWENRDLAESVARKSKYLHTVELTTPQHVREQGHEGFVVAPQGASVNDGFKIKYAGDTNDWRIVSVGFKEGEKGGVAGVVHCVSLESGKSFNLGPSQVGDQTLTREMMANPDEYVGQVLKVRSNRGHEGRASKVEMFHTDK